MQENGHAGKPDTAVPDSSNASAVKIEETMRQLKVEDNPYPDRPGEPDCIYYLKTGACGYGSNCRYNHPFHTGQGSIYGGELPERVGQPNCQYFLKTGTCKFGSTCKYHHPPGRLDVEQVPFNILGLPVRQEEKSCPYYMRTGSCKFGIACKFNHPQPGTFGAVLPVLGAPSAYASAGSSLAHPSNIPLRGGIASWPLPRPPYISSPGINGLSGYMPVVLPSFQGFIPGPQGWNTYTISNSKSIQSSLISQTRALPERPDQQDCLYFMKHGSCKYGPSCKYHHPKERITTSTTLTIGPHGLPLRPGQAVCTFYSTYGSCKYGLACKFDHPFTGYNYNLPGYSALDPSAFFPYQRSSQVIWTPPDATSVKSSKSAGGLTKPETASNTVRSMETSASESSRNQSVPSQTNTSGSPREPSD